MKKVVINICYGGFGISAEAFKELIRRNAQCVEIETEKEYYGVVDLDKYLSAQRAKWPGLYKEADAGDGYITRGTLGVLPLFKDGLVYSLQNRHEPSLREDPDLIAVIEEMGEAANGRFAELKIVEIPDDIDYVIEEYDGKEWIAEAHRTWQ